MSTSVNNQRKARRTSPTMPSMEIRHSMSGYKMVKITKKSKPVLKKSSQSSKSKVNKPLPLGKLPKAVTKPVTLETKTISDLLFMMVK